MLVFFKIVFWFLKNGPLFIYSYGNRKNRKLNYLGLLNLVHTYNLFILSYFRQTFYRILLFVTIFDIFLLWLLWFSLTKLKIWSFSRYIQNWFLFKYCKCMMYCLLVNFSSHQNMTWLLAFKRGRILLVLSNRVFKLKSCGLYQTYLVWYWCC